MPCFELRTHYTMTHVQLVDACRVSVCCSFIPLNADPPHVLSDPLAVMPATSAAEGLCGARLAANRVVQS